MNFNGRMGTNWNEDWIVKWNISSIPANSSCEIGCRQIRLGSWKKTKPTLNPQYSVAPISNIFHMNPTRACPLLTEALWKHCRCFLFDGGIFHFSLIKHSSHFCVLRNISFLCFYKIKSNFKFEMQACSIFAHTKCRCHD